MGRVVGEGSETMKLIDADKLKESFNSILEKFNTENPHKEIIMSVINTEPQVLLSCPKCHGKGEYKVPIFEDDCLLDCVETWETRRCELCNGIGKMTIEFYEMIQSHAREMKK